MKKEVNKEVNAEILSGAVGWVVEAVFGVAMIVRSFCLVYSRLLFVPLPKGALI